LCTEADLHRRAAEVYAQYAGLLKRRFRWLRADRFLPQLARDLRADSTSLLAVLQRCGDWDPDRDAKLKTLLRLITQEHRGKKLIVFTQFADTVHYLITQLGARGVSRLAAVTDDTDDPTQLAWRFSPVSNNKRTRVMPDQELDVLIATDILSEGQNLQDAAIVVNYDLPWAVIRLVQRAWPRGPHWSAGQDHPMLLISACRWS
jgi:superfamily II DNA/RNA helicase